MGQFSKLKTIINIIEYSESLDSLVRQSRSLDDFNFPLSCIDGDVWKIIGANGEYIGYLSKSFDAEWVNCQFENSSISRPEPATKIAWNLSIGDHFSYPGSFKIYRLLSDPKVDPNFDRAEYLCTYCGQPTTHYPRYILDAADGINKRISIRLRGDVVCRIHESFEDE